ncbi:kinase-like domain-containing protein [Dichotomopilus funicola]|uniref:cyclin-dependent kinase n=1 Tax=Dichotomopilus funicola TaxID=1934379 RepID=A0AAN6V468_9PEZI|nr:kinase-like domain-containing protein [Dichotomopilus funicola]
MANERNWRGSLTASERYDNIQNITKWSAATGLTGSAFEIENEAYKASSSRDSGLGDGGGDGGPPPIQPEGSLNADAEDNDAVASSPGITIGDYHNCHYIASGVTAQVYRAQARALKVIIETHNIEPHDPHREVKILNILHASKAPNIITLLETFHDPYTQNFVLVFPYAPITLADLFAKHQQHQKFLSTSLIRTITTALFRALDHLHSVESIIHRDIKPAALLLTHPTPESPSQILLSDFGTAWHPTLSPTLGGEPHDHKVLDVGTGAYRAPETLFGNRAYGPGVDLWAAGTTLAECFRTGRTGSPAKRNVGGEDNDSDDDAKNENMTARGPTLFDSRPAHEDGNQLGLVLSIFRTLGTPTPQTWPEAKGFRTPPFEMYRIFPGIVSQGAGEEGEGGGGGRGWAGLLPGADADWRALVEGLLRYESGWRITAKEEWRGGLRYEADWSES